MRWRDAASTYDADEAEEVAVMSVENFRIDEGQLWIPPEVMR